jgi:DNA-binding beta-propeller fold protein YncE
LASSGEVKTIASQRIMGHDDGWRIKATFNGPEGVVLVGKDLFICDSFNNAVRMINASGHVSTFAGSGKAGLLDGYGIDAELNHSIGITVNNAGALFVTDFCGFVIRKITSDGYVSLYAGTRKFGYKDGPVLQAQFSLLSGIVFNNQDGSLYLVDHGNFCIQRISSDGMVSTLAGNGKEGNSDGKGSKAQFKFPWQISLGQDGNLYIADIWNHAIRKITTSGNVSTVAGNSGNQGMRMGSLFQSRFRQVSGVYADPLSSSLIVADSANNGVWNISLSSGQVESIAGYGSSVYSKGKIADSYILNPSGIAFDPIKGIIYYANTDRNVISSISINGEDGASRYAGSGSIGWYDCLSSHDAQFQGPQSLEYVFINGSYAFLLIADTGNDLIRKINIIDGSVTTVAGNGENGNAVLAPLRSSFNLPWDIVYDVKKSCIYVADSGNNIIRRVREFVTEPTFVIAGNRSAGYLDGTVTKSMFNQPSG